MLYVKMYEGQRLRVEDQTFKLTKIEWETHPNTDGFAVFEVSVAGQVQFEATLPIHADPIVLDCYATLVAVKIEFQSRVPQVQVALHSEVMLDIEFP